MVAGDDKTPKHSLSDSKFRVPCVAEHCGYFSNLARRPPVSDWQSGRRIRLDPRRLPERPRPGRASRTASNASGASASGGRSPAPVARFAFAASPARLSQLAARARSQAARTGVCSFVMGSRPKLSLNSPPSDPGEAENCRTRITRQTAAKSLPTARFEPWWRPAGSHSSTRPSECLSVKCLGSYLEGNWEAVSPTQLSLRTIANCCLSSLHRPWRGWTILARDPRRSSAVWIWIDPPQEQPSHIPRGRASRVLRCPAPDNDVLSMGRHRLFLAVVLEGNQSRADTLQLGVEVQVPGRLNPQWHGRREGSRHSLRQS